MGKGKRWNFPSGEKRKKFFFCLKTRHATCLKPSFCRKYQGGETDFRGRVLSPCPTEKPLVPYYMIEDFPFVADAVRDAQALLQYRNDRITKRWYAFVVNGYICKQIKTITRDCRHNIRQWIQNCNRNKRQFNSNSKSACQLFVQFFASTWRNLLTMYRTVFIRTMIMYDITVFNNHNFRRSGWAGLQLFLSIVDFVFFVVHDIVKLNWKLGHLACCIGLPGSCTSYVLQFWL